MAVNTPNPEPRSGDAATEIVIIGTIHGNHLESVRFRPEVLREIILKLRPTAILHELPLSQWDSRAGRPALRTYRHPEGWAGDQAARQLGVAQFPFDRPDREEHFRNTRYFERQREAYAVFNEALRRLDGDCSNEPLALVARLFSKTVQAQADLMTGSARDHNCRLFDEMIRTKHGLRRVLVELALTEPGQTKALKDMRFFDADWQERNEIMAASILRIARERAGGRLAVITGAEHRYVLRDLLAKAADVRLVEFWELVNVDPAAVPSSPDRAEWRRLSREQD